MRRLVIPVALAAWTSTSVSGLEHIPTSGAFILVSNHVDNCDSYVILRQIPATLHFLARPSGMQSRFLGRFWRAMAALPADRHGLAPALQLLKSGDAIGVFSDGIITPRLVRAKAGAAALAVRAEVPVLPVAIWGTERLGWSPLRGGRRQRVFLHFGQQRTFHRRDVRELGLQGMADLLMVDVAAMLPPSYRGHYGGTNADTIETRAGRSGPPVLREGRGSVSSGKLPGRTAAAVAGAPE